MYECMYVCVYVCTYVRTPTYVRTYVCMYARQWMYTFVDFLTSLTKIRFKGFMYGTNVLDKDGISAAVVMAEMAAYLSRQGITLTEQLNNLYKRYASPV